jgi:hypothetical protein
LPVTTPDELSPDKPKAIADPWHSRPIDVHRWSDHPEALRLAESIWYTHFQDFARAESQPGPKPKTSYRNQLKVVLLDLYVAWLSDPELSIGLPMSSNGWDSNSRYNALHLTRKIPELVRRLHSVGLIDLSPGSYGGPFSKGNRNTRIRAAAPLVALFQGARLSQSDIRQFGGQECIILKASEGEDDDARIVEYEDTPDTVEMRGRLQAYNTLLRQSFIDCPTLEHDYVERVDNAGRVVRVSTVASRTLVRRIFSRGSWEKNGRFYGGWWQQVGKEQRKQIFINDVPTVEVDFKGMHVNILSIEQGVTLDRDPYKLPPGLVPGAPPELQRALIKQLVLTAINARDKRTAFAAFRDSWPTSHMGKSMKNAELKVLLSAFVAKYPHLAPKICADQGIRLMYVDSRIAARIINVFTAARVPVLCIHDSFIVPYDQVGRLKFAMAAASRAEIGQPLPIVADYVGVDEMADDPDEVRLDYVTWRQTERGPGYLARLEEFESRGTGEEQEGVSRGGVRWGGAGGGEQGGC